MDLTNDELRRRAQELENQVSAGIYDPDAWNLLAAEFEEAGRCAGAADLRARMARYVAIAEVISV